MAACDMDAATCILDTHIATCRRLLCLAFICYMRNIVLYVCIIRIFGKHIATCWQAAVSSIPLSAAAQGIPTAADLDERYAEACSEARRRLLVPEVRHCVCTQCVYKTAGCQSVS